MTIKSVVNAPRVQVVVVAAMIRRILCSSSPGLVPTFQRKASSWVAKFRMRSEL